MGYKWTKMTLVIAAIFALCSIASFTAGIFMDPRWLAVGTMALLWCIGLAVISIFVGIGETEF